MKVSVRVSVRNAVGGSSILSPGQFYGSLFLTDRLVPHWRHTCNWNRGQFTRRHDETRRFCRVGVGGVNRALHFRLSEFRRPSGKERDGLQYKRSCRFKSWQGTGKSVTNSNGIIVNRPIYRRQINPTLYIDYVTRKGNEIGKEEA